MGNENIIRFRVSDAELKQFLIDLPNRSEWIRNVLTLIYELQNEYQSDLPSNITFHNFLVEGAQFYFNVLSNRN